MIGIITTTAASLKTILCFIDAEKTPKIAFDNNELAIPLAKKIKSALGDCDGSQSVFISFRADEQELCSQFVGVCKNIRDIFDTIVYCSKKLETNIKNQTNQTYEIRHEKN